jgi:hypothetical protein
MKWVIEKANELNARQQRLARIDAGAEAIWANLCSAIEDSVRTYA